MASIFSRLFKVAQSEAHSTVDRLEDPIKMTEQGIRDLKKNLQEAMTGLAQVKSAAIRLKKDADDQRRISGDYERKAMLLLQRGQAGEVDAAEADRLASEALIRKEEADQRALSISTDQQAQQTAADRLQGQVQKLRRDISRYENELVTLRARARTAESMKKVNKQLSGVDSSSTVALLEKMKTKVLEEESLATAYGELAGASTSVDEEIDKALAEPAEGKAADSLAALKAKMGLSAGSPT